LQLLTDREIDFPTELADWTRFRFAAGSASTAMCIAAAAECRRVPIQFARLLHLALVLPEACEAHGGAARSNLATFVVGQRDDNAISTNEPKRVLILTGDFVHVM
jgi:hypothetical protein